MRTPTRPAHGTVAGYLGLMLGVLALSGGTAIAGGLINGASLRAGSVGSSKLAKNSVMAAKIHKSAVTSVKLAQNAVITKTIHSGAVTRVKLAPNSVSATAILNGSITAKKLASNSVTSANIAPGALQASDLSPAAISTIAGATGPQGATGSVTTAALADGSVTGAKVPLHVVTADGTVAQNSLSTTTASCPAGARAFGGGVTIDDTDAIAINSTVRASQPVVDANGSPTGWTGTVVRLVSASAGSTYHVYVICA